MCGLKRVRASKPKAGLFQAALWSMPPVGRNQQQQQLLHQGRRRLEQLSGPPPRRPHSLATGAPNTCAPTPSARPSPSSRPALVMPSPGPAPLSLRAAKWAGLNAGEARTACSALCLQPWSCCCAWPSQKTCSAQLIRTRIFASPLKGMLHRLLLTRLLLHSSAQLSAHPKHRPTLCTPPAACPVPCCWARWAPLPPPRSHSRCQTGPHKPPAALNPRAPRPPHRVPLLRG